MRRHLAWWGALAGALLVQTAVLPLFVGDPWRPDLTRALALWVALTGVPRGGAVLAAAAGLAVDVASGAPLGFTTALRLGVYALARPLRGVFFDHHPGLLGPFAAGAALAEAAMAAGLAALVLPHGLGAGTVWAVAWRQAALDVVWAPVLFLGLEVAVGRRGALEAPA